MFLVMPGDLEDDISGSIDYNKLKVAIINERDRDEILRIPLHDCGDGILN